MNVDTTNKQGLNRAKNMGLVPSGVVNMIITADIAYAVENLFDASRKGRVLGLFRRTYNEFFGQPSDHHLSQSLKESHTLSSY